MARLPKRMLIPLLAAGVVVAGALLVHGWRGGSAAPMPPTPKQNEYRTTPEVPYVADAGRWRRLDLFVPVDAQRAPVAVVLHGGSWSAGHKNIGAVQDLAHWLAERGVVAVPMGYRLVPQVSPEQQPVDVAAGVAWLHRYVAEYGGDPGRIALVGHSAGAHLASLVALDRSYLDALDLPPGVPAGVVGISNLFDLRASAELDSSIARVTLKRAFGEDPDRRARLSPVLFVRADAPPFLILHGKGDHLVPVGQGVDLAAALRAQGVRAEIHDVPGRDHISLFHKMGMPGEASAELTLAFIRSL
jgi:acetyl esterase/lipase